MARTPEWWRELAGAYTPPRYRRRRLREIYARYATEPALAHLAVQTPLIPGSGSTRPRLLLIGEAPGRTEERTGVPFVGPAGQVLDAGLGAADVSRSDCFITNTVKYRPEDNRTPDIRETLAGMECLRAEVALLRPRLIVPLGATAWRTIGHGWGIPISTAAGQAYEYRGWHLFPLLHPAAVLYARSTERCERYMNDWSRLGKYLRAVEAGTI